MQQVIYREDHSNRQELGNGAYEALWNANKMNHCSPLPKKSDKSISTLFEPRINPNGVHVWPSNSSCPIGFLFYGRDSHHQVLMDGHEYFEVLYLCSGSAICHVQGRSFPFEEGDLVVIKSTLQNTVEWPTSPPGRLVALLFDPDLIRCDGGGDGAEYLAPFLLQDSDFPHVVPARTGVPREVLEFMLRIRSELPTSSPMACLAVRTYLKTLLMLLVNHYSTHTGTVQIYQHQQRAVERLRPVFHYIGENCGSAIQVGDAARMCGMSETHFMSAFKHVTGVSFMKYLNQYRIQRAQDLLVRTDRSIADISLDTGYCDQSYFGAIFRKLAGTTPAAYRRRYRGQQALEEKQSNRTCALPPLSSLRLRPSSTVRITPSARLALGVACAGIPGLFEAESLPDAEAEDVMRFTAEGGAASATEGLCGLPTNNDGNLLETAKGTRPQLRLQSA
jgi:AraC-like DNA-binding protein